MEVHQPRPARRRRGPRPAVVDEAERAAGRPARRRRPAWPASRRSRRRRRPDGVLHHPDHTTRRLQRRTEKAKPCPADARTLDALTGHRRCWRGTARPRPTPEAVDAVERLAGAGEVAEHGQRVGASGGERIKCGSPPGASRAAVDDDRERCGGARPGGRSGDPDDLLVGPGGGGADRRVLGLTSFHGVPVLNPAFVYARPTAPACGRCGGAWPIAASTSAGRAPGTADGGRCASMSRNCSST